MTSKTDFEKLFLSYLEKDRITKEQYKLLMELIHEGTNDDFIISQIEQLLKQKEENSSLTEEADHRILSGILSSPVIVRPKKKRAVVIYLVGGMTAVASVLLFLFISVFNAPPLMQSKLNTNQQDQTITTAQQKMPAITSYSGKRAISLPDGSTVILNENSLLSYQGTFSGKIREVQLSGEAFFDIKHDENRPFIVHTGNVKTTVLGTAFNIKAFPSGTKVEVTVIRGRVKVADQTKTLGIITPDQQIDVNTVTNEHRQVKVNAGAVASWKDNYLFLNDLDMAEAMEIIKKRYDVKITFKDQLLKSIKINATFNNDASLQHIMNVLCTVAETKFQIKDNQEITIFR